MEQKRGKNTNNTLAELKSVMADIKAGKFNADGNGSAIADIEEDIAQLEQNTKPITLEQAAYNYSIIKPENNYENNFDSFMAGAQWQKEQDKELARKLHGMQAWIADKEMKELFTEIIFKLTS